MWRTDGNDITMVVGDYGIILPISVRGVTIGQYDKMRVKIGNQNAAILELTFSNIADSAINLELTAEQSAKLKVGSYLYSIDWYQNGAFMCNLIPVSKFRVVTKI